MHINKEFSIKNFNIVSYLTTSKFVDMDRFNTSNQYSLNTDNIGYSKSEINMEVFGIDTMCIFFPSLSIPLVFIPKYCHHSRTSTFWQPLTLVWVWGWRWHWQCQGPFPVRCHSCSPPARQSGPQCHPSDPDSCLGTPQGPVTEKWQLTDNSLVPTYWQFTEWQLSQFTSDNLLLVYWMTLMPVHWMTNYCQFTNLQLTVKSMNNNLLSVYISEINYIYICYFTVWFYCILLNIIAY